MAMTAIPIIEEIEVIPIPEPDVPDPGVIDPADTYYEGDGSSHEA